MKIDNSARAAFAKCPDLYRESYINKIEPKRRNGDALAFGDRMHQLLEGHWKQLGGLACDPYPAAEEAIELEAQAMFAAYRANYADKPLYEVLDIERTFEVAIPGSHHILTGKFDGIIRDIATGKLIVLEHKTEKRGAMTNLPQKWAMKSQVSLYMWAAAQLYGERPAYTLLDVLIRQSPKGREAASFYRDQLERTETQMEEALSDLLYYADRIEDLIALSPALPHWPRNTDQCIGFWDCEYLPLHRCQSGDSLIRISDYKPKKEYLNLCLDTK